MKEKIIFIPSAWSNELVFTPQISALKNDYDVIVADTASFDDVSKTADAIVAQYQHAACIIGLSLGGFVAQQLLIKYPAFADKAILMGTHAHAVYEDDRKVYLDIMNNVQQGKLADYCQMFAEVVTCKASHQNQELMDYIKKIPLAVGQQGCFNHHKAALNYTGTIGRLKNITTKTLILCAAEDLATPVSFHEFIHQNIPDSQLVILPHGGHLVSLEYPEAVIHEIKKWLAGPAS